MWRFDTVRATTIRDFPDVDVVDKIALARDYCVHQWLVPSLNEYARLGRSITLQDVRQLGLNYICKITQVREEFKQIHVIKYRREHSNSEAHQRRTYDFGPSLAQLFHEEIERSSILLSPVTPSATEDFDLVDVFFLVSCILPSRGSRLSRHGGIRLRIISSCHTVSVSKNPPSFGQCFPFQSGRTTFTTVAQNLNRSASRGSRYPISNPSWI